MPPVRSDTHIRRPRLENRATRIQTGMHPHVPRLVEIILRPRPLNRRRLLPIDIEHIVPLPEPVTYRVLRGKHRPHILTFPLADKHRIRLAHLRRILLMIPSVKIQTPLRLLLVLDPVDMIVTGRRILLRLIGQRNLRLFLKGHLPITITPPAVRANLHRQRINISPHPVAGRKKIPQRRLHRRHIRAVPINPQNHRARIPNIPRIRSHPYMIDLPRPFQMSDRLGLPNRKLLRIGIVHSIAARSPHRPAVLSFRNRLK